MNDYIDMELTKLVKKNIRIKVFGDIKIFPKLLRNKIKKTEKITKKNNKIQINMALNYGSKQEIIFSIKNIIKKRKK